MPYLNDQTYARLKNNGYKSFIWTPGVLGDQIHSKIAAYEKAEELRNTGNHAQVYALSNRARYTAYMVFYRSKEAPTLAVLGRPVGTSKEVTHKLSARVNAEKFKVFLARIGKKEGAAVMQLVDEWMNREG